MRLVVALIAVAFAGYAFAALPPPTDEARTKAAEAAAKSAWADKVALYQLCIAMDRTAATYRSSVKAQAKDPPAPVATTPCTNPGPYVSQATLVTSKPLEAAGAHSPPGTAVSPPSTAASAAEISGGIKK